MSHYITCANLEGRSLEGVIDDAWRGRILGADPLRSLVTEPDYRGNGCAPLHIPVLAASVFSSESQYVSAVKSVCANYPPPTITAGGFKIEDETLAVWCVAPLLAHVRAMLVIETRNMIDRCPITAEEWQTISRIIELSEGDREANRLALFWAKEHYYAAGGPPLPTSRVHRIGHLVSLARRVVAAGASADAETAHRALAHFLAFGEPSEYGEVFLPSVTLARRFNLGVFELDQLPSAQALLGEFSPKYLSILAESEDDVKVRTFDSISNSWVTETRRQYKEIDRAFFRAESGEREGTPNTTLASSFTIR